MLNCTGFLPGDWKGKTIDAKQDGEKVLVTITGSYEGTIDVRFLLTLSPDGTIDTSYEVMRLYRHMPHKVKAQIGISPGGLLEKGAPGCWQKDWKPSAAPMRRAPKRGCLWPQMPPGSHGTIFVKL